MQQSFTSTILSASSGEEETTVREPADLNDGGAACKGTVKLVSGGSLILRSGKSDAASMVSTLSNGTIVQVLANDGSWCFVQYGSLKGYVPAENLVITGTPQGTEEAATAVLGFATVTANDYVNLRQEPSLERQKTWHGPDGRGADGVFPFGGLGLCTVYEHHGLCPSQLSFCADHGLSGGRAPPAVAERLS